MPVTSNAWINKAFRDAATCAGMSYDPSTKVGAVIIRPNKTKASEGFNGFPRGTNDHPSLYANRERKIRRIVHAEANAIVTATEPLQGYSLFVTPLPPCPHCAGLIIQSGITKIYWRGPTEIPERWRDDMDEARSMFEEAGVRVFHCGPAEPVPNMRDSDSVSFAPSAANQHASEHEKHGQTI